VHDIKFISYSNPQVTTIFDIMVSALVNTLAKKEAPSLPNSLTMQDSMALKRKSNIVFIFHQHKA
jgi:hypothetical protein